MAYVSKEFRKKIISYFKDYDYSYRHWLSCYYNSDKCSSEHFMMCQRRYYAIHDLFLKILETL